MERRFKASLWEKIISDIRYFIHYNIPDAIAGIAFAALFVLLPVFAVILFGN